MILVVGATGMLGGSVTRRLLERGDRVRILVRRNSPSLELAKTGRAVLASTLADLGAEVVFGDLRDRASLDAACAGVTTVVTTANSAGRGGDDNPETVDRRGNQNLVDAAKAAGVDHFVFVSANLADEKSPVPFLAAKGRTERYLIESGIPYTIVAPEAFMDIWLEMIVALPMQSGLPVRVVGSGDRRHSFIASDDVATFVVAAVGNPRAHHRRLVVGGPAALSFREAAATFGEAWGLPVQVESVEPGAPLPMVPEAALPIAASFDLFDSVQDTTELAREFGVELTDVLSFARTRQAAERRAHA